MSRQKRLLLNRLQRLLPEGLVADAAWLTRMGYPSSLRGALRRERLAATGRQGCVPQAAAQAGTRRHGAAALAARRGLAPDGAGAAESRSAGGRRWSSPDSRTTPRAADRGRFTCTGTSRHRAGSRSFPSRRSSCSTTDASCFVPEPISGALESLKAMLAGTGETDSDSDPWQPRMAAVRGRRMADRAVYRRSAQFWSFWTSCPTGRPSTRRTC